MYDTRQEANEFVGDSLEEARAKAAEFFGTDESELKISSAPEGEIFGTAGRTVIVAAPKNIAARAPRSSDDGRRDQPDQRGGGRGGRGERDDRGGRGDSRGPRGRGGDRGRSDRPGGR